MSTSDPKPLPPSSELGYEPRDASIRTILITSSIVLGSLLAAMAASSVIYLGRYSAERSGGPRQSSFKDGVNERTSISRDTDALQRETASHLDGYGWNDRATGAVHIPVDRAMDLLSQEAAKAKTAEGK